MSFHNHAFLWYELGQERHNELLQVVAHQRLLAQVREPSSSPLQRLLQVLRRLLKSASTLESPIWTTAK